LPAPSLRLTALTWTRIDGDVIEEFVRHTARFVDRHYIVDLDSPDGTAAILQALVDEGLPITVWGPPGHAAVEAEFDRIEAQTRTIFERDDCDYVLLLDADEFIVADDRASLENALRALPEGAHAMVRWFDYLPLPGDDPSESRILARIRHRQRAGDKCTYKTFVHKTFKDQYQARLATGNHQVEDAECAVVDYERIALAHFPVRSVNQIQAKALLGWTSMLAAGFDESTETAYHWRDMYRRLLANRTWTPNELYRIARTYLEENAAHEGLDQLVLDPVPPVPQRHTKPMPDVLDVAIALSRQLAIAYAGARRAERSATSVWEHLPVAAGSLDALEFVVEPACSRIETRGWIAPQNPLRAPRGIYALVAGRTVPLDRVPRPDVAAGHGSAELEATGFAGEIAVEEIAEGRHDVHIAAEDAAGVLHVLKPGAVFDVVRPRAGLTLARFHANLP